MSLHAEHPPVIAIHAVFCLITRVQLQLNFEREANWMAWLKHKWTADDLRFVVAVLEKQILDGKRRPESLMFRNLIRDTSRFEEDLAFFRAKARTPRIDSGRASVLRASGRPATTSITEARSAADILAGEKAFEAFRAFNRNL